MFWNFVIGLVLQAISFLLRPAPEGPKAGTISDVNVPRAREGEELGCVWGTVWIKDPQVAWYGDFRTIPVKTKQSKK